MGFRAYHRQLGAMDQIFRKSHSDVLEAFAYVPKRRRPAVAIQVGNGMSSYFTVEIDTVEHLESLLHSLMELSYFSDAFTEDAKAYARERGVAVGTKEHL